MKIEPGIEKAKKTKKIKAVIIVLKRFKKKI